MRRKKDRAVHSDIVRDSLNTFGTNVINTLIQIFSAIVVLSRVDPVINGLKAQVLLWGGGFCTVLSLSVNSSVVYYVARYKIENSKLSIEKLTAFISLVITVLGAATLFVLKDSPLFPSTPPSFFAAMIAYGLSSFVLNICMAILRGENKFKSYNVVNLTQQILISALAVVIAVYPSASLWVWGTIAISLAMIVFSFYGVLRWNGTKPRPAPEDDFPVKTGKMVGYSLKSHVSNVLTYANSNLGSYIVQGIAGIGEYGVYSKAITVMQKIWILPDAVSQVILSRIAGMKDKGGQLKLAVISTKIIAYVTTAATFLILGAAYLFVPLLFPMYKGMLGPMSYLTVGIIFISCSKVLGNSIAAYGRPELNILPTVLGIAANILFSILFIPPLGTNGVALASSISMTVQGLSCMIIFCIFSHTAIYRLFLPSKEEIAAVKSAFSIKRR